MRVLRLRVNETTLYFCRYIRLYSSFKKGTQRCRLILLLHVRGTVTMSNTDHVGLTHCKFLLVFAVLMDLFGVSILLIGIFVPLEIGGRDFGDLLVYSGALLVLMSMGAWVMWYSGNIDGLISEKELPDKHSAVERFARSLSRRIRRPHRDHRTS